MRRRIAAWALAVIMTLCICSCTVPNEAPQSPAPESSEPIQEQAPKADPQPAQSEAPKADPVPEVLPIQKAPEKAAPVKPTVSTIAPKVLLADIPSYSGQPYTVLTDNVPGFTEADYTTSAFETYSPLDSLGRCGAAYACIGQELMPTEERGSIGQIKPAGWHTVKYDSVDGKYLYNRCHLIGFQLTGENANECNLITGTRYFNVEGMLPFEDLAADYIKETGNHVLYRVTPIYEGDDLVAQGVQMEAYSVEDAGDGVSYHVFVYNIQPDVTIDYATGESYADTPAAALAPVPTPTTEPEPTPEPDPPAQTEKMVWIAGSGNGTKYHSRSSCSNMGNPVEIEQSKAEASDYTPCKRCY